MLHLVIVYAIQEAAVGEFYPPCKTRKEYQLRLFWLSQAQELSSYITY